MTLVDGRFIVGVDFDGTITTNPSASAEKLELQPYVKDALWNLAHAGIDLVLWTCRTGEALDDALAFLDENDMRFYFTEVNNQTIEVIAKYEEPARKLGADIYIDDKNIFAVIDWPKIHLEVLKRFYREVKR